MKKEFQMIIFVVLSFAFVIMLWFNFFLKNITKSTPPNQDIENIKNSITETLKQIDVAKRISDTKTDQDISEIQKVINQKMNESQSSDIKSELIKKIDQRIDEKIVLKNDAIEYQYDPWGIKFSYPENMIKTLIPEKEKIEIKNPDDDKIAITISRNNKKIKNVINTTKYIKTTYNNLDFFESKEQKEGTIYRKDYYTEIDDSTYIIEIVCPYEKISDYWEALNLLPKSFSKI